VSRELRWAKDVKTVELVFHVHEGERYKVGGTQVANVSQFPREEIERLARLRRGGYYDDGQVKADVRSVEDYYGYTGRKAGTEPQQIFPPDEPGVVRVNYLVRQEQLPSKVGQVFVVGNEVTKQNVILREVPLYPGQILTYPDVRVAERNLARLNIFE